MDLSNCLLCHNKTAQRKEEIPTSSLVKLYDDLLGVSVASQFDGKQSVAAYQCSNCHFEYFDPSSAGDGLFYEELQRKRKTYYSPNRKEFSYAEKFITPTDTILEVGSGNGLFAKRIKKENYIGLEFNDKAIEDASKERITLFKKTVEEFAKETDDTFDIVCSFHVLEHVVNPYQFIKSKLALLKTGGKLIIAVPCNDSVYTSNFNHVLNLPPHHIGRWRIATMKALENLFSIKCVDFLISSPNEKLNKRDYVAEMLSQQKVANANKGHHYIVAEEKIKKTRKWTYRFNKYLGRYHFYSSAIVKGENMTFVFKKM